MRFRRFPFLCALLCAGLVVGGGCAQRKTGENAAKKTPAELRAEKFGKEAEAAYKRLVSLVQLARLQKSYEVVDSCGSRVTGSQGEAKLIDYTESEFKRLGLEKIRRLPFGVTVPDPKAEGVVSLEESGWSTAVYPLWPNLVRTSTCDVTGPMLYGGDGSLEFLEGKSVKDSIVLMEFNTAGRWRNAAKLGAKAVVFLAPDTTNRTEAEQKFSTVPLNVPRFYLPMSQAAPLLQAAMAGKRAHLACRQDWVKLQSANLIAELPGTDPKLDDEPIVVFAFADAMSVVPKLAPGANAAGGLVSALELAEVFTKEPHKRRIVFVVSGAHYTALLGAREFIESQIEAGDKAMAILLTVTLDLSSGNRGIGGFGYGYYHDYRGETASSVAGISRTLRKHADRMMPILKAPSARIAYSDTVNNQDNRAWKNNIPTRFAFDCEAFNLASYNALTVSSIDEGRPYTDTPFDTLDKVNVVNTLRQTQSIACVMHHLLNDTSAKGETSDFRVDLEPGKPRRMSLVGGFAKVEGRVVRFDPKQSFVPDVSVPNAVAFCLNSNKTMMGVRGDLAYLADGDRANYRFTGLATMNSYWQGWGANYVRPTRLAAFHVDPKTGDIDAAPTEGRQGAANYPTKFELKTGYKSTPIVVFNCGATDFYDLVDPQDLKALTSANVLDAGTDAPPEDYGFFRDDKDMRYNVESEETAVMFLPDPRKSGRKSPRFKLLMGSGLGEIRLILTNSTTKQPDGRGYLGFGSDVDGAEGRDALAVGGLFPFAPLRSAEDIIAINQSRLDEFKKYRIISAGIDELQGQARSEVEQAQVKLDAKKWVESERHARAAWGYALRAHPVIQKTSNDVVNGVVFYLFLIMPFSYFMERLFFAFRALSKQLMFSSLIFFSSFILLWFIHPAFEIVNNPTMIFIAFVMGALSLIVISFILGKFESSLKALKAAQSGVHEVDIRRVSVAMAAFNLGVSNMRRRKARTFLTTLTLVVMTFIVLSFTSIVSEVQLKDVASDTQARYTGLLFRNPGLDSLPGATYFQVANEFSGRGAVARRAWNYGQATGDKGVLTLQAADRSVETRVMVGLDPSEAEITKPQEALLPGGRFFKPGDRNVIILTRPVAEELKIDPSEVGKAAVQYAGVDYTVIGIFDSGVLRSIVDLDGDEILPADTSLSNSLQVETRSGNDAFRKFIRHDPSVCFFMPADTALGLGAETRSVAVAMKSAEATKKALDDMMPRLRLNIYASVPNEKGEVVVHQFSEQQSSKGTGLGLVLIQMIIAAVFVLNTMVASVHERTREISIFSAIGLAPNHIAMLFFAESLVYGVLGAVIGYFVAQASATFIVATGALPGLYLNFSSTSAVLSAGLVMGVVLLSTIYPARKAGQIAAPALEGDLLDEEPEGDQWNILLPFSISSREAAPIVRFLAEWFKAYEEYTIGTFVTAGTNHAEYAVEQGTAYRVDATVWIAPYDLGVSQELSLRAAPTSIPGIYDLTLVLDRLSGEPGNWMNLNKRFVEDLRKQFLTWRTMDADQRARFEHKAEEPIEAGV
jgi:ABC-type antimicrobial peptide transport system permease subunit